MTPGLRASAAALLARDLRLVWRRRGDSLQPALFALLVVMLFALAAVQLWCSTPREGRAIRAMIAVASVGFVLKLAYEIVTGQTLFVDSAAAFIPLPLVHAIGAAVGLAVGIVACRFDCPRESIGQMPARRDNAPIRGRTLIISHAEV